MVNNQVNMKPRGAWPLPGLITMRQFRKITLVALGLSALLSACGGGGGSGSGGVALKGVAATGAPLAFATVTVLDKNGRTLTTNTDSAGLYNLDVSNLTPPLLVKLEAQNSDGTPLVLYSAVDTLTGNGATANVTPLSNATVVLASGKNATEFYSAPSADKLSTATLEAANAVLSQQLAPLLQSTGAGTGVNFVKSDFATNKTGLDLVMESLNITTNPPKQANGASSVALIGRLSSGGKILTPPAGGVGNGAVSVVGGLSIPTGFSNINFTGIDTLINTTNQILLSSASIDNKVSQLVDLSDSSYLNQGKNAADDWRSRASGFGKLVGIGIQGCNFSTPLICAISGAKLAGASRSLFQSAVIYDGQNWKYYGNQRITNINVTTTLFRESYFTDSTITRNAYSGYEVVVSTEGAGAAVKTVKFYVNLNNSWQLLATLTTPANAFGDPGSSFLYQEVQPGDDLIRDLTAQALNTGVSLKLELFDVNNTLLSSNYVYGLNLPLLSGDVANFKFPEITDEGIQQFRQYDGGTTLQLKMSPGNAFFSTNEFYWNQAAAPGQSIASTDIAKRSTVVNMRLQNTMAMGPSTNRGIDFYAFTADGMKIHTRNVGCNAAVCVGNN